MTRFDLQLRPHQPQASARGPFICQLVFFLKGERYLSVLLGRSSIGEVLEVSSAEIRKLFEQEQQMFPMDYKVGIDEVDGTVVLGLTPAGQIESAIAAGPIWGSASRRVLDLFRDVQNNLVSANEREVDLRGILSEGGLAVVLGLRVT